MDKNTIFPEIIKDYIERENLTINRFSKCIGVAERAVAKWMAAEYMPTVKSAIKVAELLDCSLDYLFGLSNTPYFRKSTTNKNFFERFDLLCKTKKVTPYKVSKDCDFGQPMISKWKRGKSPKTETLIKLAEYFDCSVDYLAGRADC